MEDVMKEFGEPHVISRCPSRGLILLGGLGFHGVGEMWFPEEPHHAGYEGYAEAPTIENVNPNELILENVRREIDAALKDKS
jgi:hypothetical protein